MTTLNGNYEGFNAHWEWDAPDGSVYTDAFIYPDADGQLDEHLRKYIAPDFERDLSVDRTEWAFDAARGYMRNITPSGEENTTPPPVYALQPPPRPRLNVLYFPTVASQFAHMIAIFDNDNIQVGSKVTLKTNVTIAHDASFFLGVTNKKDVDLFVVSKRPVDGADILRWNLPAGAAVCALVDWRYFLRGAVYKYEPFEQSPGCAPNDSAVAVRLRYDPLAFLDRMPPFTNARISSKYVFLRLFWGLFKTNLFTYDEFDAALTNSALFERGVPSGLTDAEISDYRNGLFPYSEEEQETILKTGQIPLDSIEYTNSQLDVSVFREGAPLLLLLDAALAVCGQRLYHGNGYVYELFPGNSGDAVANGTTESVSPRFPPLVCFFPDYSDDLSARAQELRQAFEMLRQAFDDAQTLDSSHAGNVWLDELKAAMQEFGGYLWLYWRELENDDPDDVLEEIATLTYPQTIEWISKQLTAVLSDMADTDGTYKNDLDALKETLRKWAGSVEPHETPTAIFSELAGHVETIINGADFLELAEIEAVFAQSKEGVVYNAKPRAITWAFPNNYFVPTYWQYEPFASYEDNSAYTSNGDSNEESDETTSEEPDDNSGSGNQTVPLDYYQFSYPIQYVDNPDFRASITVLTSIWIKPNGIQTDRFNLLNIASDVEAACRETARRIAKRVETLMLSPESKTFFFGAQANRDLVFSDQEENREYFDKVSTFAKLDVNPLCLPIGSPRPKKDNSYGGAGSNTIVKGIFPFVEESVKVRGRTKTYTLDSNTPIKLDVDSYKKSITLPLSWLDNGWLSLFDSLDCWSSYETNDDDAYTDADKENAFIERAACSLNAFDFSILVKEYNSAYGINESGKTPIDAGSTYNRYELTDATQTICWRGLLVNGLPNLFDHELDSRFSDDMDAVLYGAKAKELGDNALPGAKVHYIVPNMGWKTGDKSDNRFVASGASENAANGSYERYDSGNNLMYRIIYDTEQGDKYEIYDRNGDLAMVVYPEHPNGARTEYWGNGVLQGTKDGLPPGMYKPDKSTEADYAAVLETGNFVKFLKFKSWLTVDSTVTPYPSADGYEIDWRGMRIDGTKPYYRTSLSEAKWADPITEGTLPTPNSTYNSQLSVDEQMESAVSGLLQFAHFKEWITVEVSDSDDYPGKEFNIDWRGMRIDGKASDLSGYALYPPANDDSIDPLAPDGGKSYAVEGSSLVQWLHLGYFLTLDMTDDNDADYPKKEYSLNWRGLWITGDNPKGNASGDDSKDSSGSEGEEEEETNTDSAQNPDVGGFAKVVHFKSPLTVVRKENKWFPYGEYEVGVDLGNLDYTLDTDVDLFVKSLGTPLTQSFLTGLGTPTTVKALSPNTLGFAALSVVTEVSLDSSVKFLTGASLQTTSGNGTNTISLGPVLTNVSAGSTTGFVTSMSLKTANDTGSNKISIGPVLTNVTAGTAITVVRSVTLGETAPSGTNTTSIGQVVIDVATEEGDFLKAPTNQQQSGIKSITTDSATFVKTVTTTSQSVVSSVTTTPETVLTGVSATTGENYVVGLTNRTEEAVTGVDIDASTKVITSLTWSQEEITTGNAVESIATQTDSFVKDITTNPAAAVTGVTTGTGSFLTGVSPTTETVYLPSISETDDAAYDVETSTGVFMTNATLEFASFVKTAVGVSGTAVGSVYIDANDSTAQEDFVYDVDVTDNTCKLEDVACGLTLANVNVVTGASLVSASASEGGFQVVTAVRCVNDQIVYDTAYVKIQLTTTPLSQLITFSEETALKSVIARKKYAIRKISTTPVSVLTGITTTPGNAAIGIVNTGANAVTSVTPLTKEFVSATTVTPRTIVTGLTPTSGSAITSVAAPTSNFISAVTPTTGSAVTSVTPTTGSFAALGTSGSPGKKYVVTGLTKQDDYLTNLVEPQKENLADLLDFERASAVSAITPSSASVVKSVSAPTVSVVKSVNKTTDSAVTSVTDEKGYFVECPPSSGNDGTGSNTTGKAITRVTATKRYLGATTGSAIPSITKTNRYIVAEKSDGLASITPESRYLVFNKDGLDSAITPSYGSAVNFGQVSQVDVVQNLAQSPPSINGLTGYTQTQYGEAVTEVRLQKQNDNENAAGNGQDGDNNAND